VRDSEDDELLGPGQEVGGYVIDGELGHGGMGVVYAATHPVIGKRAAIKLLRAELSRDPQAVERFINEARAVNAIGHPNIVDIFAFGTLPDGRSYCVMDLLVGESLRTRIKRGNVHISEAASILDETASALTAAHAAGIIHRDLKPDNIFMAAMADRYPEVKLLDFGLAKLAPRPGAQIRTITGSVLGTPAYMSPEQARASGDVDHRTDLYSLGVVAYELLSGQVPFKKQSSIDTLLAHQEDPVPPLLERVPTLPEELVQLVEALLSKEPDGRPTLAAMRAVLKRLKGTKIPTMTAAGLPMAPITTNMAAEPELSMQSLGPATIEDVSQVMTQRRLEARPGNLDMYDQPDVHTPPERPLALVEPTTTPFTKPLAPAAMTTLAGHSMPSATSPSIRAITPGAVSRMSHPPGASFPSLPPMGSTPSLAPAPSAAGSAPPLAAQHYTATHAVRVPAASRRWLVIAIVALLASAIGITIAVLA
jgi:serine/threonine protein kinase